MASKNILQLVHDFKGGIPPIYDHILDLRKFGNLHLHMKEVKIIAEEANQYIEYEIWEELTLFGFIRMKPNYKAKVIDVEKQKQIRYLSQVIEEIEVVGNKFVASVFMSILKKAHLQVFESLRKQLVA